MLLHVPTPRERSIYARLDLIAFLGSYTATGFTDSSSGREEAHLYWRCGCRASRDMYAADAWRLEPCGVDHPH